MESTGLQKSEMPTLRLDAPSALVLRLGRRCAPLQEAIGRSWDALSELADGGDDVAC